MDKYTSILIMIHCEQFTGYAIGPLEEVFFESAKKAGYSPDNIFWSYSKVIAPDEKILECAYNNGKNYSELTAFIKKNKIQQVLAFDLGYPADVLPILYAAGVKHIISYWGASMSSLNSGIKLLYKKIDWTLRKNKPHKFIFESDAMQMTATHGRGVPKDKTAVVALGVDTDKYFPAYQKSHYAHNILNIPVEKKIIFYSGHMEERKGVRVIVKAAIELIDKIKCNNIHFVLCGNKDNEANTYKEMLKGTQAEQHLTFAGYRNDIAKLMQSSSVGVIASTGWDSFTMSSVEMMASGLPLIVSNLQGLGETIINNVNGFHIEPGDYQSLANHILTLTTNEPLADNFSQASRKRAELTFSKQRQVELIASIIMEKNEDNSYF